MFKKSWPFLILAALSFTLHFAFLSHPAQVVFDEVHFGKFVSAYFTREYYFDIHPPLGKLMIAGWAKLNGVNPVFSFDHIGEQITPSALFALRFLPAFFGGLFVLVFSWLAYLISRSRITALVAGFLILLDNAFLAQSKFILVDIFMLFFGTLTFCFFFLFQRQKSFSGKWLFYLLFTGLFFGLTISVKWTGLATIGIIGALLLAKIFSRRLKYYLSSGRLGQVPSEGRRPASAGQGLAWVPENEGFAQAALKTLKESGLALIVVLFLGLAVYILPFYIHFKLLAQSGPGDAFMSYYFQQELKYGPDKNQPLSFWQKFFELNKTMLKANAGITSEHAFGSRWYSWPLGYKPVYYWNQPPENNKTANIYFTGNFYLWWLTLFAVLGTLSALLKKKWRKKITPAYYFLLLAYFANLLPFIFIKRVSFLYHYLSSVSFGVLLFSFFLTKLLPQHKKLFFIIFGLIVLCFLFLAPLSYGWSIPSKFYQFQLKIINLLN